MALLNRLIGQNMTADEESRGNIPVHQAMAAWGEHLAGRLPWSDWSVLISRFNLSDIEENELAGWNQAVGMGAFTLEELGGILMLGESNHMSESEIRVRLGLL